MSNEGALCVDCAHKAIGESDIPAGLKVVAWVAILFADVIVEDAVCAGCGETAPLIATASYDDEEELTHE